MRKLLLFAGFWLFFGGAALGAEVVPAAAFFPVLPFDASPDAEPQLVPLATSRALEQVHQGVTRAIVVIHDETRDASAALAMMTTLAGSENAATIILAPQFLLPSDIVRFSDLMPQEGRGFAAWQILGWSSGEDSMPLPAQKSVSSFTVVDLLLMFLSDRAAFPDLREVVVAGYGVGANFVQRYAAFTTAADILFNEDIAVRYLVAGATSYLYQTASRPLGGKRGFGLPDAVACPTVNLYPYGMEKLNPYARRMGANAAKVDYGTRAITYLFVPDSKAFPEVSCAALAQGANSGVRTENYRLYLRTIYGDVAARAQAFGKVQRGNDAVSLYGSACGMAVLFGDGMCPSSSVEGEP
jgi:hypothetical protein